MIVEPPEIIQARQHLSSFEKRMMDADGVQHLSEGLSMLEKALEGNISSDLARNLGNTYAIKICSKISDFLQEPNLTSEPKLEHLLELLLEISDTQFGDKERISELKIEIAKKLLDKIFSGYTNEEKQKIVKKLLNGNT